MTTTTTKSTITNKASCINQMFNNIASKYDLLNNFMTFGNHIRWKEEAIKLALKEIKEPKEILDLCSGTGDLGIILNKLCPLTNITCIDNSNNMLDIAKSKIEKLNIKNIRLLLEDFENLSSPLKSQSFDIVTIGFGLRNLINKEKCIIDIYDLLSKNGVFVCIDLGYPANLFWQKIYFIYFFKIVPILGKLFANDIDAYTYLPNSLVSWFKQDELNQILLTKGFRKSYYKNILGGVVAIHIAIK